MKRAGRDAGLRLQRAAADLGIAESDRLSDRRRIHTLNILQGLFSRLESALRRALALELASHGSGGREIAADIGARCDDQLWGRLRGVVLAPPLDLFASALARASEHEISEPLRAAASGEGVIARLLARLPDSILAQRAMDVVIADAHRIDGFGEPSLPFEVLNEDTASRAAWLSGAALRVHISEQRPIEDGLLDKAIEAAVRRVIAERAPDTGAAEARLVSRLDALDALTDHLLAGLATEGQFGLLAHGLARRAGIGAAVAHELLVSGDSAGLLILLRALEMPEDAARAIVDAARSPADPMATETKIECMRSVSLADARRQLARWARDPAYAQALAELRGL